MKVGQQAARGGVVECWPAMCWVEHRAVTCARLEEWFQMGRSDTQLKLKNRVLTFGGLSRDHVGIMFFT